MGLRLLLQKEPDINVIAEAESSEQVLKKVAALKPNVVILHSGLAEANGRGLFQQLLRRHPKTRLLILTSKEEEEKQIKALRLAAHIVPKHAPSRLLMQWIRQQNGRGGKAEPAGVHPPAAESQTYLKEESADSSPLSSRERQVVELVSQGFKNREIAQRMFISEQTVKNHLHNIFDKLGVSDRLELALYAIHKNMQATE